MTTLGDIEIDNHLPFVFVGGPCQIESREHATMMATEIDKICKALDIPWIFKSSYTKANRTSINSPRGVGLDEGLPILRHIRDTLHVRTLTDFHETIEIDALDHHERSGACVDVIQIPAFLCRQTDLLVRAGESGKLVNIKKGQFASGKDMKHAIEKVRSTGNRQVLVTERGNSFGYGDLVVDYRNLLRLRALNVPVVFDATHSAQKPGALDGKSGGDRRLVPPLASAAMAIGVAALFCEVHDNPDSAPSDGPNMLKLADLPEFLAKMKRLDAVAK